MVDWLTLKGVKDIQKFLGLANYYQQFIKDFTSIARPLHDLVKKDQKWDWTKNQEKVFIELKERFTKELVLVVLDLDKKIRMEVNALEYTIGGVLSIVSRLLMVDLTFIFRFSSYFILSFFFSFLFYF